MGILLFSQCDEKSFSEDPSENDYSATKSNSKLVGTWSVSNVEYDKPRSNNNSTPQPDSAKCINGEPYEFYNGTKKPADTLNNEEVKFTDYKSPDQAWMFTNDDSVFIIKEGAPPATPVCKNGIIEYIAPTVIINHKFKGVWSADSTNLQLNALQRPYNDQEKSNFNLKIDSLTNYYLQLRDDEQGVTLYFKPWGWGPVEENDLFEDYFNCNS